MKFENQSMPVMRKSSLPTAPAHVGGFHGAINHPSLYLWDSWAYEEGGVTHLYTLALSRNLADGTAIKPEERNDYPFHFRHFISLDEGLTWTDEGSVLAPSNDAGSYYSRNVWSGSATVLPDGRKLMGFTGLRQVDAEHPFLQSIGFATSRDGVEFDHIHPTPLSCPRRDYDAILAAGYYLGPKNKLGDKDGEDGGPILAWRDPYTFVDHNGRIQCFWSAKISPKVGVIAHATLTETASGFEIETLHPPMTLPDGETITQAEVPKIYFDERAETYYCLISACDRLFEGQDDSEVSKTLRLYTSSSLRGPWKSYRDGSPILENLPNMFGASILETDFEAGEFTLIAPITECARPEDQLTIARIQTMTIRPDDYASKS